MKISDKGLALIREFEGFRPFAYKDTAGLWTIGIGHKLKPGERYPTGITEAQAEVLLEQDAVTAEADVNRLVKVSLSQNQFDALTDFAYNLGDGSLEDSTLLKLLNEGDYSGAAAQFPLWDHVGGVVSAGLLRRREAEQALFLLD